MPKNRTTPALTHERLTLGGLLLEVLIGQTKALDEIHSADGLLGKEFDALLRLSRSDQHRLTMRDLAARTSTSTSGTTGLVDRLVAGDTTSLMPIIDRLVTDPVGADADMGAACAGTHPGSHLAESHRWPLFELIGAERLTCASRAGQSVNIVIRNT